MNLDPMDDKRYRSMNRWLTALLVLCGWVLALSLFAGLVKITGPFESLPVIGIFGAIALAFVALVGWGVSAARFFRSLDRANWASGRAG